jgi:hypothetical protein
MDIFLVAFKSAEFLAGFVSQPEGSNKTTKAGISKSSKNLCIGVGKLNILTNQSYSLDLP